MFRYQRMVQFYETDMMGVMHHSNYLRFFEEARVKWLQGKNILDIEGVFAVLETQCRHLRPAYFEDVLTVELQVCRQDAKVLFNYRIFSPRFDRPICNGMSLHILVDKNLKVRKLPQIVIDALEQEPWIETSHWNS
jgi:acyl-CoA thioester hydrolase